MLEYLRVAVDGEFNMNVDVELESRRIWKDVIPDVVILPEFFFGSVVVPVGPVPLEISAYLSLKVRRWKATFDGCHDC